MSISATLVRDLREKTSAGMMDCKKALEETKGDFDKAIDWLRTKGLMKAAKKADRVAAEGIVHAYIHGEGRIGVLLEVNSETDFVGRNDQFKNFVKDIALHIAAMSPKFLAIEDINEDDRKREEAVLRAKALEEGKKAEFLDKIIAGQMQKWAAEVCLLEQAYVKDPNKTVKQYLNETIATLGENLVIRRFVRWGVGEGIEKKKVDFAEEVAAFTKGK